MLAVVVAGALCVIALAAPALAALPLKTAWSNPFSCASTSSLGRQLIANPPRMTSVAGGWEKVYWSPDLYRWNVSTQTWQLYDGTKPWYRAVVYGDGTIHYDTAAGASWFNNETNQGIKYVPFNNLPSGSYKVLNYYQWADGTKARGWSNYNLGGSYCTFR